VDVERLLTTTRSARKSLDLDAPVDRGDIRECLRIGLQAANGSNQQSWRWLAIFDPALREKIAALYRDAYLLRVGGRLVADLVPADTPEGRLMSSTEWLVANMARVPLLVIPCYQPYLPRIDGDESFYQATLYGSIFPAVWNFQLALHAHGYGTCVTTLRLHHEDAVRELLGIPGTYVQGCLLPVGRLRAGHAFRPAARRPLAEVVAADGWNGPPLYNLEAQPVARPHKTHILRAAAARYPRGVTHCVSRSPLIGRVQPVRCTVARQASGSVEQILGLPICDAPFGATAQEPRGIP